MFELINGYLVFETITLNESRAKEILEGWEHKERIRPIYAIIDQEEKEALQEFGEIYVGRINIFKKNQLDIAKEELLQMNDF